MYDDDKGNPVPATPKEARKDNVDGERTAKKVIIQKKDGSKKVVNMGTTKNDGENSLTTRVKIAKEKVNMREKEETQSDDKKEETSGDKKEQPSEDKKEEVKAETSPEEKKEQTSDEENKQQQQQPNAEEKKEQLSDEENKQQPNAEETSGDRKEETTAEETQSDDKKDLEERVKNAKEKTPEEKKKILDALRAKRVKEAQQKFLERQKENNKGGHEKSEEEIKANNEKIRKERNLPDEETENVKKQEETVSSAWRKDFTSKANKGDTKGLPDEIKDLMGKYKNYWKRVNQKDHSVTVAEMDEGADLENKLKSLMRKYPDAFGKKTTVKDGDKEGTKIGTPKKLNLSDRFKKKQSDEDMVDRFIEDNSQEEGPSDEELKAIERSQRKSKK